MEAIFLQICYTTSAVVECDIVALFCLRGTISGLLTIEFNESII